MIRKVNVEDIPRLAEIHVFAWRCAYKDFISMEYLVNKMTVKNREKAFNEYLSNKENIEKNYVYEEDNMIKGFMTIGDCRDEDKDELTFELMGIYIDPLFQRQKIGTKFVEKCINEARKHEKKEITLWVFEKNIESIKFYQKMGFVINRKIKLTERFNENAIRLRMEL
jgi:ribosomal protein S18 acetylase RimI-like enzyme